MGLVRGAPPSDPTAAAPLLSDDGAVVKKAWHGIRQVVPLLIPVLLLVLPTLWMVYSVLHTGLCETLPLERLVGWMAYLPLHSAVTRQVQAQVRSTTAQAMKRHPFTTTTTGVDDVPLFWTDWLQTQALTTVLVGIGLGSLSGLLAWIVMGDGVLAEAVTWALGISCVTAGLAGPWIPLGAALVVRTCAPQDELYTWMSPLGASTQDLFGVLVWYVVSNVILLRDDGGVDDVEGFVIWDERLATFCG